MAVDPWHVWNQGGRNPNLLPPLMAAHQHLVDHEVNRWAGSGLPRVVLDAEAKRLAIGAFQTYKPGAAQLGTHVVNRLKGLDYFVNRHKADIRLPQAKVHLADRVFRAKQQLSFELGREPTEAEIAKVAGVGTTTIGRLNRLTSTLASAAESSGFTGAVREDLTHDQIVMGFLHQDLSPMQQKVFEHTTGFNGKPILPPGQIATKLGVSPARVSILKNEVATKARRYQAAVNTLMD